ncbi:MAG: hypothetical protein LIO90_04010, partial [Bacteroidales bacterium]|nr:hypothetical protein [Bacteroidales bacterium]
MQTKIILVFLLFVCFLVSCSKGVQSSSSITDLPIEELQGKWLNTGDYLLDGGFRGIVDGDLLLKESKEDLMLRRYTVEDDILKLKDAVIARGQGPLEALGIGPVYINFPKRYLISYDPNAKKALRV